VTTTASVQIAAPRPITLAARISAARISSLYFVLTFSAVYAAATLFAIFHHEPWCDEADAWLTARDLTLGQLWPWMHHAGTPALWYLILMPLAKLNFPYISMNLVHWGIAMATALLILACAPFPRILRFALVFSYYLLFEYTIIARNYAPLALLLVLIAMFYRTRSTRPILLGFLLLLLASTAVHGTIIAGAILGAWGLDVFRHHQWTKRVIVGICIGAAGIVIGLAQVLPAPADGQLQGTTVARHPWAVDYVLATAYTPRFISDDDSLLKLSGAHLAQNPWFWWSARLLNECLLIGTAWLLRRNPPLLAAYLVTVAALLYIMVFKHMGYERHVGLIWLTAWALLWMLQTDPRTKLATTMDRILCRWSILPLALVSIYSTATAIYMLELDVRYPFSGSRQAADYLLSHGLAERPLAMSNDNFCEPILPYLGRKTVYYADENRYGTNMLWTNKINTAKPAESIARILQKSQADPNLVIVLTSELPPERAKGLKLVFDNLHTYTASPHEKYAIYVRAGD
jgi:hypothetical protein